MNKHRRESNSSVKLINIYAAALFCILTLAACQSADDQRDGVESIAGLYSTKHRATVEGRKIEIDGYINIDQTGKMSVYEFRNDTAGPNGKGCYFLASGAAVDSQLQGRSLTAGISPQGKPDYEVRVNGDTFGILAQPRSDAGDLPWFFHWGQGDSTVNIIGAENIVNSGTYSFSISGRRLTSPSFSELQTMQCDPGVRHLTVTMPLGAMVIEFERSYFDRIYGQLGIQPDFQILPANAFVAVVNDGRADAVALSSPDYAENMENLVQVPEPVLTLDYRALTLSPAVGFDGWESLAQRRTCVIQGDKIAERRVSPYPHELARSLDIAAGMVRAGQCDVMVVSRYLWLEINDRHLGPFCESAAPLEVVPVFHYVSRSYAHFAPALLVAIKDANQAGYRDDYFNTILQLMNVARSKSLCSSG